MIVDVPEMTSNSNISFSPFLKSSSMFSIWVPALRRWELHQAVNVWETTGVQFIIYYTFVHLLRVISIDRNIHHEIKMDNSSFFFLNWILQFILNDLLLF